MVNFLHVGSGIYRILPSGSKTLNKVLVTLLLVRVYVVFSMVVTCTWLQFDSVLVVPVMQLAEKFVSEMTRAILVSS